MARAWRLLLTILAAARPVAGAHEKYVAPSREISRSRQAADGSTITEQAPLFGDLIDAVKWYADREDGDAGEPPDFAPGTNARRRALKTPPTHGRSRLLSAMSFRSTRSLAAASVGSGSSRSATSSRKSYRG